ncbi:MAG: efflux RND transporter periplasmic adaptor subunit [Candidatus Competibacteraceae bacterium]|nr:efflux RND transporter periplasmic adaptor subunit [Candidatus Competibacteraceae bacterium]MCP5126903.1 efflux RND transporter periplasmic adaptor subunit [Gammaproteobacteria bacterium]HRX71621.1 efflux RND transporter periplasmic adaptor subunit [Candidatus Competibacteraceae bacterium]
MPRLTLILVSLLFSPIIIAQTADLVTVDARPFREVALPDRGTAPASVIAPNDSRIAAEVTARVARIHAEVGGTVKLGQLLLELDDTDYRLALAQADAQVKAAQARVALTEHRLQQALSLRKKQFVSDDAVLELQTGVQAAKADLDVAQAQRAVAARNVEKCRIIAPFAGVVLERQAQVGALAAPGTTLLRLVDLAPPEIEAYIPTAQADELFQASALIFTSQGQRYPARLLRLSPVVDVVARNQLARLRFTDTAAPPGSSGLLHWEGASYQLPAELLVKRDQTLGAFVVEKDHAWFKPAPGAQEGRPFIMNLPPQTLMITRGHQGLNDGQPVIVDGAR